MIELIITVILVLFMGGMCFDWIFSGSINPIHRNRQTDNEVPVIGSQPAADGMIRLACPKCGFNSEYDIETLKTQGHIRCTSCGHLFGQDAVIEIE